MSVDVSDPDLPVWLRGGVATMHAVVAIAIAFLSGIVLAVLGQDLLVTAGLFAAETPVANAVTTAFQYVGFGLAMALYLTSIERRWLVVGRVRLPTRREFLVVAGGLVALFGISLGLSALLAALGVEVAQNRVVQQGTEAPLQFLYMIPVTVLFVAPGEELVYRGVVQGLYREAFGPTVAIGVASLLFGVSHWLALVGVGGTGKLVYVLIAAVLGVGLGLTYEWTGNLVVPIAVHGLYNALRFLLGYATATGLF
ncbi:MAG: lysostaphin resistance A-like protein [Haloferacaceae archaeon]